MNDGSFREELLEDIKQALKQRFSNKGLHLLFEIKRIKNDVVLKEVRNIICDEASESQLESILNGLLMKPERPLRIVGGKGKEHGPNSQNTSEDLSSVANDLQVVMNIIRMTTGLNCHQHPVIELDDDTKTMLYQSLSMMGKMDI